MKLIFSERAWEDYLHWQASDPKLLARLNVLIKECTRTPFQGTGKSEPFARTGLRLVVSQAYARTPLGLCATDDALMNAQCRYHY